MKNKSFGNKRIVRIIIALFLPLIGVSRGAAGEEDKRAREKAAFIDGAPKWTTTFVSVNVAELRRNDFVRKTFAGDPKTGLRHLDECRDHIKSLFGLGIEEIDRIDFFVGRLNEFNRTQPLAIRLTSSKPFDKHLGLKRDQAAKHGDKIYYTVGEAFVRRSFHFVDERTIIYFANDPKEVFESPWKIDDKFVLAKALNLARKKEYPIVVAIDLNGVIDDNMAKPLRGLCKAESLILTCRITDNIQVDAMLRFQKPPQQGNQALGDAVEWSRLQFLDNLTLFNVNKTEKAMAMIADSLKNPKVRQEGNVQHAFLPLKIDPTTLGEGIDKFLKNWPVFSN